MTVLIDDGSPQTGTHVLLIGVGDYPFLKGGSAPPATLFAHHMGMGQLSSPSKSVEELGKWFVDGQSGFHNPERPLRSLQILCSAAASFEWTLPGGVKQPVAKAKTAEVTQAIKDWMARASRNEENLAFLYFCGHGLSFGETRNSLLLEDFGGDVNDPMSRAIAFDELRLGLMNQCAARYQCHFIDACRTLPTKEFVNDFGDENVGIAVISGGLNRRLRDKIAPVFFASGLASAAYGLHDQSSLFLQGMLRCFRGVGSRDADDHYAVIVEAVAEGINKCVEGLAFQTQPQYCQPYEAGYPFTLHHVRGDPLVMVKVFTRNEALLAQTILSHTREGTTDREDRKPLAAPWWVPLPLGTYLFQAVSAQDATVVVGQQSKHVSPPAAQVGL